MLAQVDEVTVKDYSVSCKIDSSPYQVFKDNHDEEKTKISYLIEFKQKMIDHLKNKLEIPKEEFINV